MSFDTEPHTFVPDGLLPHGTCLCGRPEGHVFHEREDPEPMCACDVGLPQYCTPGHPPYG